MPATKTTWVNLYLVCDKCKKLEHMSASSLEYAAEFLRKEKDWKFNLLENTALCKECKGEE
jgi:hypothetical protein